MKLQKRQHWLLLLCMIFLSFNLTYGQGGNGFTLKGVIIDEESNLPLPSAIIKLKDTEKGTVTDFEGNYTLTGLSVGQTLEVTYIGMKPIVWVYNGEKTKDFTLKNEEKILDEIVVVGYGTMSKRDITGAVGSVKEDENIARQFNTVDQLLQGRLSGVQVGGNSGNPGGAVSVKIRGVNSLRGNNEPLYVVDGVIISSAGETMENGSNAATASAGPINGLAGINPRDIANIEVLKDASATAIYGSRGANGVVLITTKGGSKGDAKINAYAQTTISQSAKNIDVLDGYEYAMMYNERNMMEGWQPIYVLDHQNREVYDAATGTKYDQHNWQNEIFRNSVSYNAGMSIQGGTEKSKYYFSVGYQDQEGIVQRSKQKGGDMTFNLNQKVSNKLSLDVKNTLFYMDGMFPQTGNKAGANNSLINRTVAQNPLTGVLNQEDNNGEGTQNTPVKFLENNDDITKQFRNITAVKLNYKISKAFKFQVRTGLDYRSQERKIWFGPGTFQGDQYNGLYSEMGQNRTSYNVDGILSYNKKFGKKHRVNATAVVTYDNIDKASNTYVVSDFDNKSRRTEAPQLGKVVVSPYKYMPYNENVFSYLGRVNYTFNNKYTVTANFRADKSSKFAEGHQWGYFPSASAAWFISEEAFLNTSNVVSDLKMRAGWGVTGNQGIPPYNTFQGYDTNLYGSISNGSLVGTIPNNIPNASLTWETTEQYNVGVDFGFFKSRINGSLDVYHKTTRDLLQKIAAPASTGFDNFYVNRGTMSNQGVELNLEAVILDKKDWGITVGGSITKNITELGDLGLPSSQIYMNGTPVQAQYYLGDNVSNSMDAANIFISGQPIGLFYGYKTDGIYTSDEEAKAGPLFGSENKAGDIRFVDQNGDGVITAEDRTIIGDPNPDFIYSFRTSVRYKSLSLSMLWSGVQGNDVLNANKIFYTYTRGGNQWSLSKDAYYNAWSQENPNGTEPRILFGQENVMDNYVTDQLIEDGSYLRLANITLAYDLPVKTKSLSNINLYFTATNPFTFTKYSGYDPEVTNDLYNGSLIGVDWGAYPNVRSYLIGCNLTF
ncbi:SusC/RagA family TonB-linked outer membrane protein [Flammeovirga yaeyamensis]|uniref:SusC/RagA family TonB-linked outer membrane protein n=1 Tax=Flammeovirga yaeyamensis TaxID=367791 RepID=A0AAX1NC27_9BACT|nr:TonB-dependent receptor [Flammeovirga yaeyamensis]MBB3696997.1 TonB-linked SusC/RagA family outer membrane protein [Flammeovirga yaeyamensis]NMF33660.1 TonB-dependent receptor [Flammeovirga yaeyamensis]QWG05074.1 SusC/RagA family TonB-linked outer membrane protein [Flammeovirga yaeyamensis]